MLYIDQIPLQLKGLMDSICQALTKPQADKLPALILAMAACGGRKTVKSLSMVLDPEWARSSLNDYFTESPWPAPDVLRAGTLSVLDRMRLQPHERIELIVVSSSNPRAIDVDERGKSGQRRPASTTGSRSPAPLFVPVSPCDADGTIEWSGGAT